MAALSVLRTVSNLLLHIFFFFFVEIEEYKNWVRGVKLTTHLHLVPRSRMIGAIPPLPQYAFMAWCSVKKAEEHRNWTEEGGRGKHLKPAGGGTGL
jgi:hypothetical protein